MANYTKIGKGLNLDGISYLLFSSFGYILRTEEKVQAHKLVVESNSALSVDLDNLDEQFDEETSAA